MYEAEPVRAPRYSLWLGGRLGVLLYGGSMYYNQNTGYDEQTSAFVTNGLALEADVGARIARRYIPYLALELGLVGPGSRFQGGGTSAQAGTSFLGIGFRFLAGNVNFVSFASDLSFGFRKFQVSNDGNTWTASAFEFLRLGLGADIRFTDYFHHLADGDAVGRDADEHERLGDLRTQPVRPAGRNSAAGEQRTDPQQLAVELLRHHHRVRRALRSVRSALS